jgi:hypothetical protein
MTRKKISVGTWAYIWGGYSDKPIPFPTVVKKLKELSLEEWRPIHNSFVQLADPIVVPRIAARIGAVPSTRA